MDKISVVVPVYNTVNELRQCLDSIANQTYTNLEIICVDDGSTDGSEKLVDAYAQKDSRFIAHHQENSGESSARNMGLQLATGDYIAFCDCDDWLENDMYEVLMHMIKEYDLDIAASSWIKETSERSVLIENQGKVYNGILGKEQLLNYIYMRDYYRGFAYMWNKIYKRDILLDEAERLIMFPEKLKLGGDVVYLARAALNAKKSMYTNRGFYHYRQREASGCHTTDVKKLRDWIRAYKIVIDLFEQKDVNKCTVSYVKRFMAYHASNFAEESYKQGLTDDLQYFQSIMRLYKYEYLELNKQYKDRCIRFCNLLNEKC